MDGDRRYDWRREVTCRVDYATTNGQAGLGLIKNLSANGVFVAYATGLTVGQTVVTAFALPNGLPFKLRAKVARVSERGAGLQFVGLTANLTSQGYPDTLECYCAALYKMWLEAA